MSRILVFGIPVVAPLFGALLAFAELPLPIPTCPHPELRVPVVFNKSEIPPGFDLFGIAVPGTPLDIAFTHDGLVATLKSIEILGVDQLKPCTVRTVRRSMEISLAYVYPYRSIYLKQHEVGLRTDVVGERKARDIFSRWDDGEKTAFDDELKLVRRQNVDAFLKDLPSRPALAPKVVNPAPIQDALKKATEATATSSWSSVTVTTPAAVEPAPNPLGKPIRPFRADPGWEAVIHQAAPN